jgi:PleD family two-component response regulator
VQHDGTEIRFTSSLGVAGLTGAETLDQLIARADAALYDAKRGGRNRVMSAA